MKNINEIIEEKYKQLSSLDPDLLTEKEIDMVNKFLEDVNQKVESNGKFSIYKNKPEYHIQSCTALLNGFDAYLQSLKIKTKNRENIPNWYVMNKI